MKLTHCRLYRQPKDQRWNLLRQRRALREFGGDASQARARDADIVEKYIR